MLDFFKSLEYLKNMAARKNRGTKENPPQEGWRKKISATKIIQRLDDCVHGKLDLTAQQIKAAEIILRKIEPDLNKTDVQQLDKDGKPADAGFNINIRHVKADAKTD